MENDVDFNKATRRLLFGNAERKIESVQTERRIPGAGKSAAERPERHVRVKVTMNVDGDVVEYFKQRGKEENRPYQTLMNQVLKEYVKGSRVERLAESVSQLLREDEEFLHAVSQKVRSDDAE